MRVMSLKRKRLVWVTIGVAIIALVATGVFEAKPKEAARLLSGMTILVDPGHGGKDMGATGFGGLEEEGVVLAIALHLKNLLQAEGVNVVLTRETDTDLAGPGEGPRKPRDLHRRAEMASEHKADLVVSIHANAVPSPKWSGAQTFYDPSKNPLNEVLATTIQSELSRLVGGTNRQASSKINHYLLKNVSMPATTVEVGFLSNPREERLLGQADYQQSLAYAIFNGIMRFVSTAKPATRNNPP